LLDNGINDFVDALASNFLAVDDGIGHGLCKLGENFAKRLQSGTDFIAT
jgi:hypothetical protein